MKQLGQQAEEQKTIPTLISKQERLFLNSVSSIYSRRAYSYFLHNYLKQQVNGSLEQFLSRNPKEIEDELIDFIITSKEKGMKRAAIFNYIKPMISCCKINDVAINTTKVRKFMLGDHLIELEVIRQPLQANQPVEHDVAKWNIKVVP
jgi:hypothetical protein